MKNFLSTAVLTLTICLGLIVNAKSNSADEFNQYLANTINYPEKARLAQLQGNSIVLFNLNRGKLSGLKIAAELGNGSDIEVVNAVMAYPGFSQMKDGKYAVHAAFRLEGANAELINKDAKLPDGYMAIHVVIQGKLPAEALVVTGYRQQPFKVSNGSGVVLRGNANPFAAKPLIILDSVQLDYADFQGIDPNGIESIHIYKDVSTVANYGEKAINGVIVITTKKTNKTIPAIKETNVQDADTTVYNFVALKNPPTYPGGLASFYRFLNTNIKYPSSALKNRIEGSVHVSFIVEKDGSLTNIKTLRELGYGTGEEAVRVLKLSKKWNPGIQNGHPIRVKYAIPVKFKMN